MKLLEALTEFFSWLQIFLCPTILLGIAGIILYHNIDGNAGVVCFTASLAAGIALGIYFAERIRRTIGCTTFMSRKSFTPGKEIKDTPDAKSKTEN